MRVINNVLGLIILLLVVFYLCKVKGWSCVELFKNVINMVDFDIVFFELDIMSILLMIIFNFMGILKVDEK